MKRRSLETGRVKRISIYRLLDAERGCYTNERERKDNDATGAIVCERRFLGLLLVPLHFAKLSYNFSY